MTQPPIKKILVAGEECGTAQLEQKRNDFRVQHSGTANVKPDLPDANAAADEQFSLVGRNVLIEHVHERVGSRMNSSACFSSAGGLPTGWLLVCPLSLFCCPSPQRWLPTTRHAVGHLLEDIRYENLSAAKGRLAVADFLESLTMKRPMKRGLHGFSFLAFPLLKRVVHESILAGNGDWFNVYGPGRCPLPDTSNPRIHSTSSSRGGG